MTLSGWLDRSELIGGWGRPCDRGIVVGGRVEADSEMPGIIGQQIDMIK